MKRKNTYRVYDCNYCKLPIIDGNWTREWKRKFFIFKKIVCYRHQECYLKLRTELINKVKEQENT